MVAAEPSATMLAQERSRHTDPRILWVQDSLPSLAAAYRLGLSFDLILLSAVWIHVRPADRAKVLRKPADLLNPGGVLAVTLRHGPRAPGRETHPVSGGTG